MIEVEVVGVRVEMPSNQPMVLLREKSGARYLPVWIGAPEASAIAFAQQGVVPPRPLTHDLLVDVVRALGRKLVQVRVTEVRDSIYYAELVFDQGTVVSARTSDAVAVALRTETPVFVAEAVMDAGGVAVAEEEDDEVEKFREFLDHVSAEDFDTPEGGSGGESGSSGS